MYFQMFSYIYYMINTLKPEQNDRQFIDGILNSTVLS